MYDDFVASAYIELPHRYKLFSEPLDRALGAKSSLGIPLIELPVLLEPRNSFITDYSVTRREQGFRQLHYLYYYVHQGKQGPTCFSVNSTRYEDISTNS